MTRPVVRAPQQIVLQYSQACPGHPGLGQGIKIALRTVLLNNMHNSYPLTRVYGFDPVTQNTLRDPEQLEQHWVSLHLATPAKQVDLDKWQVDSLIGCSPHEVAVHGAILQLTGGHPVQLAMQGGTLGGVGAIGLHTAHWLSNKMI